MQMYKHKIKVIEATGIETEGGLPVVYSHVVANGTPIENYLEARLLDIALTLQGKKTNIVAMINDDEYEVDTAEQSEVYLKILMATAGQS